SKSKAFLAKKPITSTSSEAFLAKRFKDEGAAERTGLLAQRASSASSDAEASAKNASDAKNALKWETIIVSSDLDMLQIVDENTKMYRLLKGFSQIEEVDVAAIEKKYGIKKSQFLDLKALKGDASDNIPGVKGIGEKTAVKLLNQYGSVAEIYNHLDEISGRTQKLLANGKASAEMSYQLGKIMFDAPVELSAVRWLKIDTEKILAALKYLEFTSLIRKYQKLLGETTNISPKPEPKLEPESEIEIPSNLEIAWRVKEKMSTDKNFCEKILSGKKFYDLEQGKFLLNPLMRKGKTDTELKQMMFNFSNEDEQTEYRRQLREFQDKPKLYKVLTELDFPMIPVLYKMEKVGMLISREHFQALEQEYTKKSETLLTEIYRTAGMDFNVNSPIQLSEVLFEKLSLPTKGIKKTTRGYSTGAKELEKLLNIGLETGDERFRIIPLIMNYRETAKLLSTYISPLPTLADKDGRIHTTFTQDVTATGRLSSQNPNLQNIPARTEEGRRIRAGFIAPAGKKIVSADYSQFELRLAAALADDEELIRDFNSGIDIHKKTAADAFHVNFDDVTDAQRRAAKVINFGILYGMSVKGLADAAKMEFYEAKSFMENYFAARHKIQEYLNKILQQAREAGFVETMYGRRRPTPDVKSPNFLVRSTAERAAQNMPIQGTEADLMKKAMIEIDHKLPDDTKMIMQVHDSVMVECPDETVEKVSEILKSTMENIEPSLKVKLAVDLKVSDHWT
ncbi:MAG: DNA polymerase, partial [Candidatus Saccharibacteria bacterium]|nr:DNA polymerase [Candidatus Saccharibacteria bacterium]